MDDTRDRLIALERDVTYQAAKLDEMSKKVSEMHALLTQARGARWAILSMVGLASFAGWFVAKSLPLLSLLPR